MRVDGKKRRKELRQELKERVAAHGEPLRLAVLSMSQSKVTDQYLLAKQRFGESIGVEVWLHDLHDGMEQVQVEKHLIMLAEDESVHGIVIQLPLPEHIDRERLFRLLPAEKDPDALSESPLVLAPVVAAAADILKRAKVAVKGKDAVVVGEGKLVGAPAKDWLLSAGSEVTVVDEHTKNPEKAFKQADIIISGAGVPGLIKPDMLTKGVALIDAGTSEEGGKLVGDADPACEKKCEVFTPVPGGVGPMTIAFLFGNLLELNHVKN